MDLPGRDLPRHVDDRSELADWLRDGFEVDGKRCAVPDLSPTIRWDRRASSAQGPASPLQWPSVETSLSSFYANQTDPQGPLVSAADAPTFLDFATAASFFFGLEAHHSGGGSFRQGIIYRHQDLRARFDGIQIFPDRVEVAFAGEALAGTSVEMAGDRPGRQQMLSDPGQTLTGVVTFSLDDGLPEGAWILLRRDGEWIDRRFLNVRWTGAEPGVAMVIPPASRLQAFIANREGIDVEFKREVPDQDTAKRKVMKTVSAFANGHGGSILFGIDDDTRLVGIPAAKVDRLRDQLTQIVDSWVDPRPTVRCDALPIDGSSDVVLELVVERGTALYGSGRPGETPTVYVRHLATTVPARPAEIAAIVRSRGMDAWVAARARF